MLKGEDISINPPHSPFVKGGGKEDFLKNRRIFLLEYNGESKHLARQNRKTPTEAEKLFWSKVRRKQIKGYQFYRQKPIGGYIVDFYCPAAKIVIEIDGGGHFTPEMEIADQNRSKYLESVGLRVIRYNNTEVLTNIEGVVENLYNFLT